MDDAFVPQPGAVIDGRYRLDAKIGEGGFGVVFKALQLSTEQTVAVKVLLPKRLEKEAQKRIAVARFRREMKLIGQLHHPHIVRLIDSGELPGGSAYMVLEFIDGQPLSAYLREEGPLSPALAVHLMKQVLDALHYAHALGVVHRDLKPQNIMVTRGGLWPNATVLDFGIAGVVEDARTNDYDEITTDGTALGTPGYMAPEQITGDTTGPESDIFAWGLILAECVVGRLAAPGGHPVAALFKQATRDRVELPAVLQRHPLGTIVGRATVKSRVERYREAKAVLAELDAIAADKLETKPIVAGSNGRQPAEVMSELSPSTAARSLGTETDVNATDATVEQSDAESETAAVTATQLGAEPADEEDDATTLLQQAAHDEPSAVDEPAASGPGPSALQREPAPQPPQAPVADDAGEAAGVGASVRQEDPPPEPPPAHEAPIEPEGGPEAGPVPTQRRFLFAVIGLIAAAGLLLLMTSERRPAASAHDRSDAQVERAVPETVPSPTPVPEAVPEPVPRDGSVAVVRIPASTVVLGLDEAEREQLLRAYGLDYEFELSDAEVAVLLAQRREHGELRVMTYEATWGVWRSHAKGLELPETCGRRLPAGENDAQAVTMVTPLEAELFCSAVGMRLPTSREWEGIARGAEGRAVPIDGPLTPDRIAELQAQTRPGALKWSRTPEGVVDLAGSVREWVRCGADALAYCVDGYAVRGGAAGNDPLWFHAAVMGRPLSQQTAQCARSPQVGFRCVAP